MHLPSCHMFGLLRAGADADADAVARSSFLKLGEAEVAVSKSLTKHKRSPDRSTPGTGVGTAQYRRIYGVNTSMEVLLVGFRRRQHTLYHDVKNLLSRLGQWLAMV